MASGKLFCVSVLVIAISTATAFRTVKLDKCGASGAGLAGTAGLVGTLRPAAACASNPFFECAKLLNVKVMSNSKCSSIVLTPKASMAAKCSMGTGYVTAWDAKNPKCWSAIQGTFSDGTVFTGTRMADGCIEMKLNNGQCTGVFKMDGPVAPGLWKA